MSAIAGMSGMRGPTFGLLVGAGLVLRMLFIVLVAEWFREPIEELLAWIERIWLPGTAVMLAGVLIYKSWRRRRNAST
jgi:membrane protein DedA with SNARE-associated domain